MTVTTIDPSTARLLTTYDETTRAELGKLLDRAVGTARVWRDTPQQQRAAAVGRLADVLRAQADKLALLATREMGKPLAESRAEIEKCAWACGWYADYAPEMLRSEPATLARCAAGLSTRRWAYCWRSCRGTSRTDR